MLRLFMCLFRRKISLTGIFEIFEKILICTRVVFIGLFIDIFSHPVPISHFSWCV